MDIPPDGLPGWLQIVIGAGVFIGTAYGGVRTYLRQFQKPTEDGEHVVLEQAAIADMRPVRDGIEHLKRIADAAEAIRDLMQSRADEEEIERRIEARIADRGRHNT